MRGIMPLPIAAAAGPSIVMVCTTVTSAWIDAIVIARIAASAKMLSS
jgi:hypothetical protein